MNQSNYCPNCGQIIQPGQPTCSRCGTQLNQPQQYQSQNQQAWYNNDPFASGPSGKSRGTAALLALLLGGLGIHYFYLGKAFAGIMTIILTTVTCGLWSTLTLVQAILMFCMDNQTFERKYVETNSSFPLF